MERVKNTCAGVAWASGFVFFVIGTLGVLVATILHVKLGWSFLAIPGIPSILVGAGVVRCQKRPTNNVWPH